MTIIPPRIGPQPWDVVRTKLDQSLPFANMRDTPYYRDAVWEQFSKAEYDRRYRALRAKMREQKLDVVDRPRRPEPLELRRRHAVADRPLGMARAVELRAGAARGRADHDLFHGRHARRSRAPAGRGRGQGRPPQPQRPLCRHHGRAHPRTETRARPHRPDGDRSAARRLPSGQSIQCPARKSPRRGAGIHQRLSARAAVDP